MLQNSRRNFVKMDYVFRQFYQWIAYLSALVKKLVSCLSCHLIILFHQNIYMSADCWLGRSGIKAPCSLGNVLPSRYMEMGNFNDKQITNERRNKASEAGGANEALEQCSESQRSSDPTQPRPDSTPPVIESKLAHKRFQEHTNMQDCSHSFGKRLRIPNLDWDREIDGPE